jgi:hypothetical protein
MAITQPSKRNKADAFAAGAPDAKREGPKLRGKRQPIAFTLPPDLIADIDEIAAEESRSRAKMIEVVLRGFVRDHRREAAREAA